MSEQLLAEAPEFDSLVQAVRCSICHCVEDDPCRCGCMWADDITGPRGGLICSTCGDALGNLFAAVYLMGPADEMGSLSTAKRVAARGETLARLLEFVKEISPEIIASMDGEHRDDGSLIIKP